MNILNDKKSKINEKLDYEKIYGPEFLNILNRIEELDGLSKKFVRSSELRLLLWDSNIFESKRRLTILKEEINTSKKKLESLKRDFINIVYELKMCLNQDEFDKFKKKTDTIQFENFITREEFIKMLVEKFDESFNRI